MNRRSLSLTVFAAGVAVTSSAAAQVTPDAMIGGRLPREVNVQVQARVEHNTNIARTNAALADQRGISRADTLFLPSVTSDIVVPLGRQALFLQGSASYAFHDKNSRLDHSRFDITGGVGGRFGPCGVTAAAGYTRGRSELEDYTLVSSVNNILEIKRLVASAACVRPPGIGLYGSVSKDWGTNTATSITNGDYESTNAQGGLQYRRAGVGMVGLIGIYGRTEYKNRPIVTFANEGFETRGGGLQLERRLGGRIQANASVSYVHVEPLGAVPGADEDFNGVTYTADLTYRASSRLSGMVNFSRNVSPTLVQGQSFEVQTVYGVGVDYRLGSRFQLGLNAEQHKSDSRGLIVATPSVLTRSRTRIYQGSLDYRLNEKLSFTLIAGHEERRADNAQFNYNNNRVGLGATYAF